MRKYFIIICILLFTSLEANYDLYIASTKYQNISRNYIEEINNILQIENLIVRTHKKKNYSVLVRNINDIKKAKNLQKILNSKSTYKDSYIKENNLNPDYYVLYETKKSYKGNISVKKKNTIYKHNIENSNEYITASTMYNIGNYKKSYFLFNKLFKKYSYNININYFLAQSAAKINKHDEAIAAYERILMQKPNLHKIRLEYTKNLSYVNLKKEAIEQINILLKSDISKDKKEKLKQELKKLTRKKKYSYNTMNILLGVGHSSNVNGGLISENYRLPGLDNIMVSGEKAKSDFFHNEIIAYTNDYIFKNNPSFKLKNSIFVFNKNYINEDDENTTVFAYKPNLSYINNGIIYGTDLNIARIKRANKESFNLYGFKPMIIINNSMTSFEFQKVSYLSVENEEKDFNRYDILHKRNLFKNFNAFVKYSKIVRHDTDRIDIDKKEYKTGLNYLYKINNKNMIELEYEFSVNKYKFENLLFNSKREDKNHYTNLSYSNLIDKKNKITLSASYTKNNSNQDAYIYEEKEIKLNYLKKINW